MRIAMFWMLLFALAGLGAEHAAKWLTDDGKASQYMKARQRRIQDALDIDTERE